MRKLFFSLYVILVLTFIGVGWSLDQILSQLTEDSDTSSQALLYENILNLSANQLQKSDNAFWDEALKDFQSTLSIPIFIESLDDFTLPDTEQQTLLRGGIIYLSDDTSTSFYKRIGETPNVLGLGPINDIEDINPTEIVLALVFYLCLALALLLWFWPLWRNLQILNRTAIDFGHGHFDSRAILPGNSSLFAMANTFNNMAERIQRLIKSQKELTNAVSHELRTPIARLRFGMEMLDSVKDPVAKNKYISGMNTDLDELDTLVDEMLTYARLDSDVPQLKIYPQDILGITSDLLNKISLEFTDIKFSSNSNTINSPVQLNLDKQTITRAMENLLRNATKHAKSQIQLNFYLSSNNCEIHIEDDGAGIDAEHHQRIFEPFIRLDSSRDRSSGGTGLGLSIVQRIVEWHQGKIWVSNSDLLGGARFCIRLPVVNS